MRKTSPSASAGESRVHPSLVAVNSAAVAFVDELLRMPSPAAAATAVELLFGPAPEPATSVLSHVNGGIHIPLASLLTSSRPLAVLLSQRLRVSSAWRNAEQAVRGARAAARARYRELQSAFVAQSRRVSLEPAAALVRYTYGSAGRQWLWEDAAARVLHRVTSLNRAVLDLLAAVARGRLAIDLPVAGDPIAVEAFDLPEPALDLMAVALPPVAAPDWGRFSTALDGSTAALATDESVVRYRSLLAEILGLSTADEEAAP